MIRDSISMYVLCVGMYRSGSTWQYEVVSHLIERYHLGRRLGFVTAEQFAAQEHAHTGWAALKAHEGHIRFTAALSEGRAVGVYVRRDLRDVAFSLAHVYRTSFEDIVERQRYLHLCLANDEFWSRQPGMLSQRYESIIADPAGAVAELAEHLGITLEPGEAEAIAAQYSLEANRGRAAEWEKAVRSRGVDPSHPNMGLMPEQHTLLHWNHIRDGRAGGWRTQATARQRLVLALVCGHWLKARGYEPDDAWAMQGVAALDRMAGELEGLRRAWGNQSDQLAQTQAVLRDTEDRLLALERLGPVALRLAAWFHETSLRHPRLRSWLKRLLGFGGTETPREAVPELPLGVEAR